LEEILHQLIGSFSHYFQGLIHPNGGWPWDFFHQSTGMITASHFYNRLFDGVSFDKLGFFGNPFNFRGVGFPTVP